MSDTTAAERARRYRARKAEQLAAEAGVIELLRAIAADVHELLITGARTVDKSPKRDVTAPDRDVTVGIPDAPTRARDDYGGTPPKGASPPVLGRDAVTAFEQGVQHGRILSLLDGRAAHTVAAIADACDLGQAATVRALIELRELGLVDRIAGDDAHGRDRWQMRAPMPPPVAGQIGFDEGANA